MIKCIKLKSIIIIINIITCISLISCKLTPVKEIVIPRDNIEKIIIESSITSEEKISSFNYIVPEHITKTISAYDGKLNISVDSNVNFPIIDSIPIGEIVSKPFTQEKADLIRNYFMQDGVLVAEHIPTKEDYDKWILQAKTDQFSSNSDATDAETTNYINELVKEREHAPEKNIDVEITDYTISSDVKLSGMIVVDNEEKGLFGINENEAFFNTDMSYRLVGGGYDTDYADTSSESNAIFNMTSEQAEQAASSILSDLEADGMKLVDIQKVYYTGNYNPSGPIVNMGYRIYFMREFSGMMPVRITSSAISPNDKFDVSPPVNHEIITMFIDVDSNIKYFSWENPVQITGILTEHVDILPFDDIMNRFQEFSKIQFGYLEENENTRTLNIFDISFKLIYLPIKNDPSKFMYAPCWFFAYDIKSPKYIIFSAIDGASVSAYSTEKYNKMLEIREENSH